MGYRLNCLDEAVLKGMLKTLLTHDTTSPMNRSQWRPTYIHPFSRVFQSRGNATGGSLTIGWTLPSLRPGTIFALLVMLAFGQYLGSTQSASLQPCAQQLGQMGFVLKKSPEMKEG